MARRRDFLRFLGLGAAGAVAAPWMDSRGAQAQIMHPSQNSLLVERDEEWDLGDGDVIPVHRLAMKIGFSTDLQVVWVYRAEPVDPGDQGYRIVLGRFTEEQLRILNEGDGYRRTAKGHQVELMGKPIPDLLTRGGIVGEDEEELTESELRKRQNEGIWKFLDDNPPQNGLPEKYDPSIPFETVLRSRMKKSLQFFRKRGFPPFSASPLRKPCGIFAVFKTLDLTFYCAEVTPFPLTSEHLYITAPAWSLFHERTEVEL